MRLIESCNETVITLLSRDHNTPVKRSQNYCQEITALLSRDYNTPIKRLQHSYQEITTLLSRDHNTPVKRLQHSCQEITTLLSRDHNTPKFLSPIHFIHITLLPEWSNEKIPHSLKNGRSGY